MDVARPIASHNTILVSILILLIIVTFSVTRLVQLQSRPIALGADPPPFFVFLTPPSVATALLSSPFTRLVVAAPHLSREVEDLYSALTFGLVVNARVSTSPCIGPTSVPGKCVVEVEEEEQNK